MRLKLTSWEDGHLTEQSLNHLDRWQVQAAHQLVVTLGSITIRLEQQPHNISGKKLGVAAVSWDGAFVLAQFLAGYQSADRWTQSSVVELGSGTGLLGLYLARMGAEVLLTDQPRVVELMNTNIKSNELSNRVHARALEWGTDDGFALCQQLARGHIDFIVAADCIYLDQDGVSPSTADFLKCCALLSSRDTRCFVAFELRSSEVHQQFLDLVDTYFKEVKQLNGQGLEDIGAAEHVQIFLLQRSRLHFV